MSGRANGPVDAPDDAIARSFPPLEGEGARVLILGSMPGVASLEAARYYAHPRNAFWPIALALLDGDPPAPPLPPYEARVARLVAARLALWDVLAACVRPGSLDAAIRRDSERPNDIPALVARHPGLRLVAFNGQAAAKLYERHVAAAVRAARPDLDTVTLPSTSPAHAALSPADKRARWHAALAPALADESAPTAPDGG